MILINCVCVNTLFTKFGRFCASANFILHEIGELLKVLPGQPN
jgi:hypothetical protein